MKVIIIIILIIIVIMIICCVAIFLALYVLCHNSYIILHFHSIKQWILLNNGSVILIWHGLVPG